jgi:hypothetical protein
MRKWRRQIVAEIGLYIPFFENGDGQDLPVCEDEPAAQPDPTIYILKHVGQRRARLSEITPDMDIDEHCLRRTFAIGHHHLVVSKELNKRIVPRFARMPLFDLAEKESEVSLFRETGR